MSKALFKSAFTVGLLALLMAVPVYGASINKSINIDAGSESDGATSVNGSITVGEGAVVSGDINTVNGKVRIGDDARVEDASTVNGSMKLGDNVTASSLETVNGSITVGQGGEIGGEIEAINGSITLEKGAVAAANVGNVNGSISLEGSEVGGDIQTVSGSIKLSDSATVRGDIIIEKPSSWWSSNKESRMPEIIIGPGSTVEGKIVLEREVKLYISETAEVGGVEGVMNMDDAVRFSGDRP
jgi:cytoskeletal protein CcmA (bactofilin family)/ethanolamine utilization microcompartment shell protein EutS